MGKRDPNGNRNVAYLYWNDERWYLNFNWLDNNFNRNYQLTRCQSLHTTLLVKLGECLF